MKQTKVIALFLGLIGMYSCGNESEKYGGEKEQGGEEVECVAPADWFVIVDGSRKTPAPNEGATSVFANNDSVTNCDFHQWSWQKFLWLTNEVDGRPLFMDSLVQVSPNGIKLKQDEGILLTSIAQASSSTDTLRTAKEPSETVYYSIFMDTSMYNTMMEYGPVAIKNPKQLEDVVFPVGALEVKASWIDATALTDTSLYFITDGQINGVKARVALLGMHVVGVVENHPEFVWATFEHENLTPKYDWSQATPTTDAAVTSDVDYPFFSKEATATVQNITSHSDTSSPNNTGTDVFSVYKYGVPVQKVIEGSHDVQVFMETSQNGSQNFNHIRTINKSVKSQLTGVWNSYFYNGSIWIDTEGYETIDDQAALLDSLSYNLSASDTSDLTRGSVAAYNITMETYVQVGFSPTSIHGQTVGNLVNCFSCHNTYFHKDTLSPLYISHVFTGYVNQLKGLSEKENKQNHLDEITSQFLMRLKPSK